MGGWFFEEKEVIKAWETPCKENGHVKPVIRLFSLCQDDLAHSPAIVEGSMAA